jgi:hypothetical protein
MFDVGTLNTVEMRAGNLSADVHTDYTRNTVDPVSRELVLVT